MGRGRDWLGGLAVGAAVLALAAIVALGAAAVGTNGDAEAATGKRGTLKPFADCERLRSHLRRHPRALGERVSGDLTLADGGEAAMAPTGSAPDASGASPASTNVQEAGVDEPDLVKVRGNTVLALAGNKLHAVDAAGETPVVVGSVELPGDAGFSQYGDAAELLVHGDRALVIAGEYAARGSATRITEVAIGDPAQMAVESTSLAEGHYVSARLTGGTARLVVSTPPPVHVAESGNGRALVPRVRTRDRVTGERTTRKLVSCRDVRRPARFAGADMLTVITIDLEAGMPAVDADAVMTAGEIVYASPTSLYVATERWLGAGVPRSAIPSGVSTRVHRFDASRAGITEYVASGQVPGFMLSQWSMSEHEGVLRVASTTVPPWREGEPVERSQSFLTTLAVDGDRLREVGRVGGLGEGEQIYAVRMIGERGYVVTFRQVDPLYVLDLSDATEPRVLGELKIPGYSAYLHPVGEGYLLGVGQDASGDGVTRGVQASLFDVRDPARPVRLDQEGFGRYSYSEVEYDHHAFSFFPEHGLAVFGLEGDEFLGAAGLRIDPTGTDPISRVAKVSHGPTYEELIRRSLLVGGRVHTVSASGIASHDPATLARLGFAAFAD